jgi:hypothetical protein
MRRKQNYTLVGEYNNNAKIVGNQGIHQVYK